MVTYSDHPNDLSNAYAYHDFVRKLRMRLKRCSDALVPGGRLVVLGGDVHRFGSYTPIVRDVLTMEPDLGWVRSITIKAQHNCRSDRNWFASLAEVPIRHE